MKRSLRIPVKTYEGISEFSITGNCNNICPDGWVYINAYTIRGEYECRRKTTSIIFINIEGVNKWISGWIANRYHIDRNDDCELIFELPDIVGE